LMYRIMMDSDGNPEKLLPNVIEGGITGTQPLEAASEMDARTVRRKYGERLFLTRGQLPRVGPS